MCVCIVPALAEQYKAPAQRFSNLQAARREGQANDISVLEEQVFEILRDWNSELSSFSPASSLLGISIGSSDHLLPVCDKDDATSALSEQPPLKPEISLHNTGLHNAEISIPDSTTLLDYQQMDMYQESEHGHLVGADFTEECQRDAEPSVLPYIRPPPSAFMGPKCALWDCLRPALGSEWYRDYCSSFHATLSLSEESTGLTPVVRPGGIHLKDSLLLVAATAKAQGKNVGIPKCEGAATAKTPWNATDLFDVTLLEGETVREWLFFDKHKRAFESGRRKQRSLPDHSGGGCHESRKLVMTEFGGQKKSYFMDP